MYYQYNNNSRPNKKSNVIYHGSPHLFKLPSCQENTRRDDNGKIIWKGKAVFASHDRRIALNYTFNKDIDIEKYTCGVGLTKEITSDEPLIISVFGDNEEDTLNKLYGTGNDADSIGYLYLMNADFFEHEEGLGSMEKISRTPEKFGFLLGVVKINRRKELELYIEKGLIKINFHHYSKLHNHQMPPPNTTTSTANLKPNYN